MAPDKQKTALIVGGGIAGMTAAFELVKENFKVTVIEKEKAVGGLARTFRYNGYTYDIGPHRFYSSNKDVIDFLHKVMGENLIEIERLSAVHYCDRYHTWPLRLKSVFQMPLRVSVPAFFDLFTKGKYRKLKDDSFKTFILQKYGTTLYETFFKGYTEKFIGLSPEEIHFHWAKMGVERATIDEKIKTGSISQLFRLMLMPKPKQLNFLYPPGGCDYFCERLKEEVEKGGGEVITDTVPDRIEHDSENIKKVFVKDREFVADVIIWTAPLTDLFDLLKYEQPGLNYLDLLVYNLELSEKPLEDYQWCYFGDKDLVFSRTTNPAQFDSDCVPEGKGALCVEVTCPRGHERWEDPEKVFDNIIKGLAKAKSISDKKVVKDIHVERIPNTYPVYDINYIEKTEIVKEKLRKFRNLFLAGRTGLFWYNNMDHSIENAMTVVEKVIGHSPENAHMRLEDPFHLGAAVGDPSIAAD